MWSAKFAIIYLGSANIARSSRNDAPAARRKRIGSFQAANARAGSERDESESRARTFIALLDLGVSHIARLFRKNCARGKMT